MRAASMSDGLFFSVDRISVPKPFSKLKVRVPMKTSKNNFRFFAASLGIAAPLWIMSGVGHAGVLYFNGFEPGQPGTADFYDGTTSLPAVLPEMTIVPNGGGQLGLTAASGSFYAEVENQPGTSDEDGVQTPGYDPSHNYGNSVFTDYGAQRLYGPNTAQSGVATSGPFYESSAIYLNTSWAPPSYAPAPAFWIDTTPNNSTGGVWNDETNFRVSETTPGNITVQLCSASQSGTVVSIPSSGWYTFETTYEESMDGSITNDLSVIDAGGDVLGSWTSADESDQFSTITGTNYGEFVSNWRNGFANNVLGIDNIEVGTVPEPASFSLMGVGALALLRRRRRTPN
jgi:hypothetical protein